MYGNLWTILLVRSGCTLPDNVSYSLLNTNTWPPKAWIKNYLLVQTICDKNTGAELWHIPARLQERTHGWNIKHAYSTSKSQRLNLEMAGTRTWQRHVSCPWFLESAMKVCDEMHTFLAHSHLIRLDIVPPFQKGSFGLAEKCFGFSPKTTWKF